MHFNHYDYDSFSRDLSHSFTFIQGHIRTKDYILDIEFVTLSFGFETILVSVNEFRKKYLNINVNLFSLHLNLHLSKNESNLQISELSHVILYVLIEYYKIKWALQHNEGENFIN